MLDTIHNPILGLYTKQAFGKSVHKAEDAWLQQPRLTWNVSGHPDGKPGQDAAIRTCLPV